MSAEDESPVIKHKILVVDDDETFRMALKYCLIQKGYEPIMATGGRMAAEIIKNERIDAVISDINMPDGNGIDLLTYVKQNEPMPFILMTGLKTLHETQQAFDLGADFFLAKPFEKKDLNYALDACFSKNGVREHEEDSSSLHDELFTPIEIDEFVSGKEMQCDIFIRLNSNKYVKIAHGGENMGVEQIKAYKAKGINHLYMNREDFQKYLKFSVMISQKIVEKSKIPTNRKLIFLKQTSKLLLQNSLLGDTNSEAFKHAQTIVESTVLVLAENDELFQMLEMLQTQNSEIYAHSLSTSMLAVLIANQVGWTSSITTSRLAAAGLFHDIGLKEIPTEILNKKRSLMTLKERVTYETHTLRGGELLKSVKGLSDEIISIVLQHHENEAGYGYPYGLKKSRIHPLAKILAVADEFIHNMDNQEPTVKNAHESVRRMVKGTEPLYDVALMAGLMKMLQMPEAESREVKESLTFKAGANG